MLILGTSIFIILAYLAVGAFIGWLAGLLTKGKGFGCAGNVTIGIVGALIGGFLFKIIGVKLPGTIGSILTALGGAVLLLFVINLFNKKK